MLASNNSLKTAIAPRKITYIAAVLLTFLFSAFCLADNKVEMDTATIKGNHELPKILYIVPWKDVKTSEQKEQKLVLHDFFGDLYDPILVSDNINAEPTSDNSQNPDLKNN